MNNKSRLVIFNIIFVILNFGFWNRTPLLSQTTTTSAGHALGSWVDRTASQTNSPTAGEDVALIYDPRSHRIILFGGKDDENQNSNEVWTFDLTKNLWEQININGAAPPASEDHSLIYDPLGYRVILFGGEDGPTWNNTWSFDLTTFRWSDLTDSTAPKREDHTAIYDSRGKRMVVFGGQENDDLSNEIWTFDLDPASTAGDKWQKLTIEDEQPLARYDHAAVYDSANNRMIIYGGWDENEERYLDDTWTFYFEHFSWRQLRTKKSYPPKRRHAVGVLDSARNWFIIQGGFGEEGYLNDVWAFDLEANTWLNITPGPQPRIDHSAIYDPKTQRMILFGGDAGLQSKFRDLWELRIQPDLPLDELLKEAGAKRQRREAN